MYKAAEYMDSLGVNHALQQPDQDTLIEQSHTVIEVRKITKYCNPSSIC